MIEPARTDITISTIATRSPASPYALPMARASCRASPGMLGMVSPSALLLRRHSDKIARTPTCTCGSKTTAADMAALLRQDLANVEAGIYPVPADHDGSLTRGSRCSSKGCKRPATAGVAATAPNFRRPRSSPPPASRRRLRHRSLSRFPQTLTAHDLPSQLYLFHLKFI
jgi:hypothetical protein